MRVGDDRRTVGTVTDDGQQLEVEGGDPGRPAGQVGVLVGVLPLRRSTRVQGPSGYIAYSRLLPAAWPGAPTISVGTAESSEFTGSRTAR